MKQSSKAILIAFVGVVLGLLIASRHQLFDKTPPVLVSESWADLGSAAAHPDGADAAHDGGPPSHAVFGQLQIDLVAHDADNDVYVGATLDGEKLAVERREHATFRLDIDADTLAEGEHVLALDIHDQSFAGNGFALTRSFAVDRTPPTLELGRSSGTAAQGATAAIFVRASEPLAHLRGALGDDALPAFVPLDDGLTWRSLTGINVKRAPGDTPLTIDAVDTAGHLTSLQAPVTISATRFPEGGVVQLSPKKQEDMLDKAKSKESNDKRSAAYATEVGLRVPDAPFLIPAEGPVSSAFGKVRRYNTGVVRHHLGTDLAVPRGAPVAASAAGQVVLAELLHIYGNAVIVNHGDGVSTSYNHLSRIDVAPGDVVAAGDVVGAVGSTGQSTGPHLHWGMVVDGTAVAAEQWTTRRFARPLPDDFD